jgi:DNA-binding SARP family transcriptional activator
MLGPLEVWRGGERLTFPPKQRALLALLLLRPNSIVPLEGLVESLWNGTAPATAVASVRNSVAGLRRKLGSDVVETRPGGYAILVAPGQLDLARFELLVSQARSGPPEDRADKLAEAVALWRGLPLVEAPSEPGLHGEIARLEELYVGAREELIEVQLELGRHAEVVPDLERLVRQHPLRERLWAQLMVALYRSGRHAEALAAYRDARRHFVDELGLEPGVPLKRLELAVLLQDPALSYDPIDDVLERASAILPLDPADRVRSLADYAFALDRMGDHERASKLFVEARDRAEELDDEQLLVRVRLLEWDQRVYLEAGSLVGHRARAEEAAEVFDRLGDLASLADALRMQAQMTCFLGRAADAEAILRRSIAIAQGVSWWQCRMSRAWLVYALTVGPTPVASARAECEAHASADDEGALSLQPYIGWLAVQAGEVAHGRDLIERAQAATRREGRSGAYCGATVIAAHVAELTDDVARAVSELGIVVEILRTTGNRGGLSTHGAELARALALQGEIDEAEEQLVEARAQAADDDFSSQIAWRRALGVVRGKHGVPVLEEAVGLASASDWLNLRAGTLEDLARVQELAGNEKGARQARECALATYERKGNRLGVSRVRAGPDRPAGI